MNKIIFGQNSEHIGTIIRENVAGPFVKKMLRSVEDKVFMDIYINVLTKTKLNIRSTDIIHFLETHEI